MRTTVCILAAGRGTRMGDRFGWINKALLPLEDRALLTRLVSAFGEDARFVIALGHRAAQVRAYVEAAHSDLDVVFVDVDPWEGPGSGPGRSLACCRAALGGPFWFAPCDALIDGAIDPTRTGDLVGVARVAAEDSDRYCNLRLDGARVIDIADKVRVDSATHRAFTGVMRIESTDAFWAGIEAGPTVAGERQVSAGLQALVERGTLEAFEHPWIDVGDEASYRAEIVRRHGFDFSKPGEAFFRVPGADGGRVVKLFPDDAPARRRVERGRAVPAAFPPMLPSPPGTVVYRFVDGETLYGAIDRPMLDRLLDWLERTLWRPVDVDPGAFAEACDTFHRGKTLERTALLEAQGGLDAEPERVEGVRVPGVRTLLERVNWPALAAGGTPVVFHGDLQFDNVVATPGGGFTLLDWRQDFAGRTDAGDLDYDLAKMLGGIRIDYARVKTGAISHRIDAGGDARLDVPACRAAAELEPALLARASALGRDPRRIELLVGLLHLSMTPLHGEPFSSALRDLARLELARALGVIGAGTDAATRTGAAGCAA